jgi:excinuclease ABC subunit C
MAKIVSDRVSSVQLPLLPTETDEERVDRLKEKVKNLPQLPGVYIMKMQGGKIIYVGKAKSLRNRVRSYFSGSDDLSTKTKFLVKNIFEFDYMLTQTEVEAFLLEASLIKKHRPKYNIRLKDDKAYPYICLSMADPFPRLYLRRKVEKNGSLYFGPFTSGLAVSATIKFLNRTFMIRDCTDGVFKIRKRPCMTYQIGRCTAPCVGLVDEKTYGLDIDAAKNFLRGKNRKVVSELSRKMKEAAFEERFETAAKIRDSIDSIKKILEKQSVINPASEIDQDVIGFFGDEFGTMIETLHIRQGVMIGNRSHYIKELDPSSAGEDVREWLTSFINQYYFDNIIPDEILLTVEIGADLTKLLEAVLKERSEHEVITVRYPTDEKGQTLVTLANQNAKSKYDDQVSKNKRRAQGLEEIKEKLDLPTIPRRIECFDISNIQGTETVASQVVFEDGLPAKDHYRRYKIRTVEGPNDFASMREVLTRRLGHDEWDDPDLIVVDGGKGQLGIAVEVLAGMKKNIPVVGLAKARTKGEFSDQEVSGTEERFYIPGRANPVTFRPASDAFQVLVGIRDEAHRFAITYHRKLRGQTSLESELDFVVGLGEKRKKELLKRFSSVDDIKAATVEQISSLHGFNQILAERILLQLNESDTPES